VGNGKTIHIWDDKWLPTPTTYKVISPQKDFGDFPMVSALIDHDTKGWRRDKLERIFLPFEVETILNIPISYHAQEDQLIWVGNKNGTFTVKSAYYVARKIIEGNSRGESSVGDVRAPLWKMMWHLNIPAKVRIFAWRLCMNAIPTMLNLNKRGVQVDPICPLCKDDIESVEHAIFKCDIAGCVWKMWVDCPISLMDINWDASDMAIEILHQGTKRDLEKFFGVAWRIWLNRNQVIYEEKGEPTAHIWTSAIRMTEDYKDANDLKAKHKVIKKQHWEPPPVGFYTINVDGAIPSTNDQSGAGLLIRD